MKQSELHHHGASALRKTATGLACLALIFSAACDKTEKAPPAPPTVQVMTVIQKDVPIQKEWVGSLDGNVNATIRPQVTGYLIKQNYHEGDVVKRGQVLFEIDPRTFKTAVEQAKGVRNQQQANLATAAANFARVKPLAEKNALSPKDLDDATGRKLAAQAALDQANAALETAQLNLDFTKITAPIEGVAGIAKAQIGDLLSPNATTELTTVSSIDPIKVYIFISEQEYLRAFKNRIERATPIPLDLILADGSVYPQQGHFTVLDRQVDTTTGTFKLGAIFPNKDGYLRPGLFGRLRATLDVQKGALLVPQRAVTEIQGKYLVAVVGEGNKVDLRPVRPGERIGSDWIINEGLKPGESIIVEGTQKVRAGAIVTPKPYDPAADSQKSAPAAAPAEKG